MDDIKAYLFDIYGTPMRVYSRLVTYDNLTYQEVYDEGNLNCRRYCIHSDVESNVLDFVQMLKAMYVNTRYDEFETVSTLSFPVQIDKSNKDNGVLLTQLNGDIIPNDKVSYYTKSINLHNTHELSPQEIMFLITKVEVLTEELNKLTS